MNLRNRAWATWIFLAFVPPITAMAFYYGPVLKTGAFPFLPGPDAKLYLYQFARAAEVNGRYWDLAKDDTVGKPYPHGLAKHPGFLEGIDLQEIAAVAGRWFNPDQVLHLCVLTIMSFNGWVAVALIYRATRSPFWSALGAVLIIVNAPTAFRVWGNLNLYKHGFVLLASVAFFDFIASPNRWRGLWLGVICGLILQGSFYYSFLTTLAFAFLFAVFVVQGKISRPHVVPTLVAGISFCLLALAFTFPILILKNPLAGEYFERTLEGVWTFGAELWQYFRPLVVEDPFPGFNYGGANFPGLFILISLAIYGVASARGWIEITPAIKWANRLLLLAGVLLIVSLRGGPGILLFDFVKSFRCFDRAGLIAVGICCVAMPIVVAEMVRQIPSVHGRRIAIAVCCLICANDVRMGHDVNWALSKHCWMDREILAQAKARLMPSWVSWLSEQPADVKMAAFGSMEAGAYSVDQWHNDSLSHRANEHHHSTLNGAEFRLLSADLRLLGAKLDRMTPTSLRFVASLGYNAMAFDPAFLKLHRWVDELPWLDKVVERNGWQIRRVNASFKPFLAVSLAEIASKLANQKPVSIAPGECVTERLELTQTCVILDSDWATVEWLDQAGRRVGKPGAAFGQRVFGPTLPALRFVAPNKPGDYTLRVSDEHRKVLAERRYKVEVALASKEVEMPTSCMPTICEMSSHWQDAKLIVENLTDKTLHSKRIKSRTTTGFEFHPAISETEEGIVKLAVSWRNASGGPSVGQNLVQLPCDLKPRERLEFAVAEQLLGGVSGQPTIQVTVDHVAGSGTIGLHSLRFDVQPNSSIASFVVDQKSTAGTLLDCVDPITGDFDGDGRLDFATRNSTTGMWYAHLACEGASPARPWCGWSPNSRWGSIVTGDFNGDGKADIAGRDLDTSAWWVAISKGDHFEAKQWGAWANTVEWTDIIVGDFNGDGKADIAGRPKNSSVYFSAKSAIIVSNRERQ